MAHITTINHSSPTIYIAKLVQQRSAATTCDQYECGAHFIVFSGYQEPKLPAEVWYPKGIQLQWLKERKNT
jgi:hypothetical protein